MAGGSPTFTGSDPGDEFSNNLFSDLAPLLALFGEKVAMQFMAESMGWADNIIFAMAPIGVLTTIVGAIRVGGATWLKALIGRAKENIACAEVELMSSTSDEVCEVFNGRHVVRLMGKPAIKELIYMPTENGIVDREGPAQGHDFWTLSEALRANHLRTEDFPGYVTLHKIRGQARKVINFGHHLFRFLPQRDDRYPELGYDQPLSLRLRFENYLKSVIERYKGRSRRKSGNFKKGSRSSRDFNVKYKSNREDQIKDMSEKPPNISLNVHTRDGRGELHVVAAIGTVLQLGVLVFDCFITYHPTFKQQKGGRDMRSYAFPLTCIGTLVVVLGILLCSYIIESVTTDKIHKSEKRNLRMLWIQQGGSVDDQLFDSYLILAREERDNVITSRRQGKDRGDQASFMTAILTTVASVVTIIGFTLQFVGLRSMTWSASISQLVATVLMIILRAYVRRGLSKSPWANPLPKGHEIDWLATRTSKNTDLDRLLGKGQVVMKPRSWWSVFLGVPNKAGASIYPWNDHNDDGFWSQGSFEWNIQTVGDLDRYRSLRKPLDLMHPAVPSVSAHHVEARMKLRSNTGWSGPALEQAVRVASAIEAFMNAFFPKDSGEGRLVWSINDTMAGETRFNLELDSNLVWKANVGEIEAFLSLWLFSVSEKESQSRERIRKGMEGNLSGTASKNHSLRLLAPMEESILQCMYWWLGSAIALVREAKIPSCPEEGTDLFNVELNAPRERIPHLAEGNKDLPPQARACKQDNVQRIDFERHRIVGYQAVTAKDDTTTPTPNGNTRPAANDKATSRAVNSSDKTTLVVMSDASLDVLYAQELFSAFIRSFAQFQPMIGPIKGSTKTVPVEKMKKSGNVFFESIGLEHKELNRVVKSISRSGLGSVEDIMLSILPPLIMESKIFDNTAVVYAIRDYGRAQEAWKRWERAGELYVKGVMTFQSRYWEAQQRAIDQATCALTEFIRELSLEIGITELYREQRYHGLVDRKFDKSAELTAILREVSKALRENGNIVSLAKIGLLYNLQGRKEGALEWIPEPTERVAMVGDVTAPEFWTNLHNVVARSHWISFKKQMQDAKVLSAAGKGGNSEVRPDTRDFAGLTPLHHAKTVAFAKSLLGAGASVTAKGHDGFTPLHSAARLGQKDVVELLIEHGSDLNPRDNHRRTPLHWAAYKGFHEVVGLLLEKGADPQVVSDHRRNPLHMAACGGHCQTVRTMIRNPKVDIRTLDSDGRTALHLAVAGGHSELIPVLSKDEDSWPTDCSGWTAIHLAIFLKSIEIVKCFLDAGLAKEEIEERLNLKTFKAGKSLIHVAAQSGQLPMTKFLVQKMESVSLPIDVLDNNGDTALMCAASGGQHEVVGFLLERGSDLGALNKKHQTAVHLAAFGRAAGCLEVVRTLLSRAGEINIDTKDEAGYTPLLRAAASGQTSIVGVLIGKCDINATDSKSQTALHHAVLGQGPEFEELTKLLVSRGAKVNLQDKYGDSPLDLPAARSKDALKDFLFDNDGAKLSEGREMTERLGALKRRGDDFKESKSKTIKT